MKEDQNDDAYFTTMFDLYALPEDFPGFAEASMYFDPYQRVNELEKAFELDIGHRRFVPYIQLHEFEALLLSDPTRFASRFPEHKARVDSLVELCANYQSPELIDDGVETAPSKRIVREIPDYAGSKASAGPLIAKWIGLPTLRERCPHFDGWIGKLEGLTAT